MRRTRLTAAGVAAALALGGTLAGASDGTAEQTVTISVVIAPRAISINHGDVTLNAITYGVDYSPDGTGQTAAEGSTIEEATTVLTFSAGADNEATLIAQLTSLQSVTDGVRADVRWQDVFAPNPSDAEDRRGVDFEIGLTSNTSCTPVISMRCMSIADPNFRPTISAATTPDSTVSTPVPLRMSMFSSGDAIRLVGGGSGTAPEDQPIQKGVSGTATISYSYRGRPMPPSGPIPDAVEIGLRYLIVDSPL